MYSSEMNGETPRPSALKTSDDDQPDGGDNDLHGEGCSPQRVQHAVVDERLGAGEGEADDEAQ